MGLYSFCWKVQIISISKYQIHKQNNKSKEEMTKGKTKQERKRTYWCPSSILSSRIRDVNPSYILVIGWSVACGIKNGLRCPTLDVLIKGWYLFYSKAQVIISRCKVYDRRENENQTRRQKTKEKCQCLPVNRGHNASVLCAGQWKQCWSQYFFYCLEQGQC